MTAENREIVDPAPAFLAGVTGSVGGYVEVLLFEGDDYQFTFVDAENSAGVTFLRFLSIPRDGRDESVFHEMARKISLCDGEDRALVIIAIDNVSNGHAYKPPRRTHGYGWVVRNRELLGISKDTVQGWFAGNEPKSLGELFQGIEWRDSVDMRNPLWERSS